MMSPSKLPKLNLGPVQFEKFFLTHKNRGHQDRVKEIRAELINMYWWWIPSGDHWLENTFGVNSNHPLKNKEIEHLQDAVNGNSAAFNYVNQTEKNTAEGMWLTTEKPDLTNLFDENRSVWILLEKPDEYSLIKCGAYTLGIERRPSILIYYDAINKRNL